MLIILIKGSAFQKTMIHVTLVNPPMVTQKGDFFGTGIPYMPLELVQLATYLKSKGYAIELIDAFGKATTTTRKTTTHFIQGLSPGQVRKLVPKNTDLIIIYAGRLFNHEEVVSLITELQKMEKTLAVMENTQAVTAYSLRRVSKEFFRLGVDYLITGEPELRVEEMIKALAAKQEPNVEGILTKKRSDVPAKKAYLKDIDNLPAPDWSMVALHNYWRLGVSHAPLTSKKYLPLQTSRGCPYPCTFCVIPDTNERTWRFHSPKYVVDEMEENVKKFGVREFHLEDLNPGILKKRIEEICHEILKRKLKVSWKIGSGTKIEHLNEKTLELMAKAGCTYISISPESGSKRILKLMDKYFDHDYALSMIKAMHKYGIASQACFVLGYPGEEKSDLQDTKEYIKKLAKAGCDEIALFILTPSPGSKVYEKHGGPKELSSMTFSPTWRKDYTTLMKARMHLYSLFGAYKLLYHPLKTAQQPLRMMTGRYRTKMEMTPVRLLKTAILSFRSK